MLGKVLVTARAFSVSPVPTNFLIESDCEVISHPATHELTEDRLVGLCQEADALICGMEPITARVIDSATRLKVIARTGVGYDTVDIAAATRRGIPVGIAPGTNEHTVADLTIGLMVAIARHLVEAHECVQRGGWDRIVGVDLWRKTLSIIGLGRVGKAVARRARGFDMRILAYDVVHDEEFAAQCGLEYVSLERALREGDFISLNAPHTPETENLINERTIALMKPSAYLINVARGGLVDEKALAEAVLSKRIAGAAVDVLREEPPRKGSPLIGIPGIIVTPHMAAYSYEAMERMSLLAAQNVVAVLKGQRALYTANPEAYSAASQR